jgi:hypothetical protein
VVPVDGGAATACTGWIAALYHEFLPT